MGINRKMMMSIFITFILLFFSLSSIIFQMPKCIPSISPEIPFSSGTTILPDKVYTFLAPEDSLVFENLTLAEDYIYYIFVKLVTPHIGYLTIQINDPLTRVFNVFSAPMYTDPQGAQYFTIPFGTVFAGDYNFTFHMESEYNLNLYIRITREMKCLHDKISPSDLSKLILYQTTCFFDGMQVEHNIQLETDRNYKFFIGRISAISAAENAQVYVDKDLTNPNDIVFILYDNETAANVDELDMISFGTATEGIYTLKIEIRCEVEYVNIAYAVAEGSLLSYIVDPNQTDPVPQNNTGNEVEGFYFLPSEWVLVISIASGLMITLVIIVYFVKRGGKKTRELTEF